MAMHNVWKDRKMMNPGVGEEVGKAAGTFMQIMKDQPLSLALAVMNMLLLGLFFYVIQTATGVRQKEMDRIFEAQSETNKLLFNCVPSDRRGEMRLQSDDDEVRIVPLPQSRPLEATPQ